MVEQNFAVAVHYAGNKAKAETLVENIVKSGGEAISVGGDVADEAQMIRAFDFIESQFGGIDVVINTAGIMKLSPIATLDMDDFDLIQRTNVRGTFVVSKQVSSSSSKWWRDYQFLHFGNTYQFSDLRGLCC